MNHLRSAAVARRPGHIVCDPSARLTPTMTMHGDAEAGGSGAASAPAIRRAVSIV